MTFFVPDLHVFDPRAHGQSAVSEDKQHQRSAEFANFPVMPLAPQILRYTLCRCRIVLPFSPRSYIITEICRNKLPLHSV